jgi:protein SCO1/2
VSETETEGSKRRGSVLQSPYFWAVMGALIVIPAMRPFLRHEPPPPPVQFELPQFALVDSGGAKFGSADLAGRVYVADFIFTRCGSICPQLTRAMGRLDQRYREHGVDGVRLVSITIDPTFDSPEVLGRYAAEYGIDTDRWTLLTGPPETIRTLIIEGFHLGLGDPPGADTSGDRLVDIVHSGKLVLVDGDGGIRGYYDSDGEGLDELFHRSLHVLKEASR